MANLGTETPTVQQPIIKYAGEIGWQIVSHDDALTLRMGENGTLFYRVLEDKLDRNELEGQLSGWVERVLGELKSRDISIEPATSKARLRELLAFDSDVVSGVITNIDVLKARFFEMLTGQAQKYLALTRGKIDDRAVEAAIDAFVEKEQREEFYKFFKALEMLYEILSPSPDLRDYVDDFGKLSALYQIVRNAFRKKTVLYGDIARKTELLVRESVVTYGMKTTMPVIKIDGKTLEAIKKSGSSDKSKIINLINSIGKTVSDEEAENPYLRTIGDRAEQIQEAFDERQISTKEALKKIAELIQEIVEARRQQKEIGFDINTFTIFWILKQEKIENPEKLAPAVNSVFERFPNFRDNPAELREIKAELYKLVLPILEKECMIGLVEKLLKLNRT